MFILCMDACFWSLKTMGESFSEKLRGGTLVFKTLDLPLLCNSKTKQNLKLSSKAKL